MKKIIYQSSNGSTSSENYKYDDDGNLLKISGIIGNSNNPSAEIIYTRNSSGKIITVERKSYGTISVENGYGLISKITENYTLDSNNKYLSMMKTDITYSDQTSTQQSTATFIYTTNKLTQINYSNGNYLKYNYDSNGNVIYVNEYNASLHTNDIENMTYDNKVASIQISDEIASRLISPNNVTSLTAMYLQNNALTGSSSFSNSYTYNNQDKPISSTRIADDNSQLTVSYSYY